VTRGGIPIEKNVIVVDEQGIEYEAIYLKRARGLVKYGSTLLIENTICLACPPNIKLEEHKMSEFMNIKTENVLETTETISAEPVNTDEKQDTFEKSGLLTMGYVLSKIEEIHQASLETSKL
jgi:hypothetical protein